jgi:hypothetical protein
MCPKKKTSEDRPTGEWKHPPFRPASEQMKVWAASLAAEAESWPHVSVRSFFGFSALYRQERIFAALPRTKSMWTPNSIGFKIETPSMRVSKRLEADPRIEATRMRKSRWFRFELSGDKDLHDALDWLAAAYESARKPANWRK